MIQILGWTLIHSLWEICAVAAMLFTANLFLRRASAEARYVAAMLALFCCVAAPIGTYLNLRATDSAPVVAAQLQPAHASMAEAHGKVAGVAIVVASAEAVAPSLQERVEQLLPLVVRVWALGLAVMWLRLIWGLVAVQRLVRKASPCSDLRVQAFSNLLALKLEIRRPIYLRVSESLDAPAVVGLFKTVVLVPAGALLRLSPEHLEALMAHEIAHIRRCDYVLNMLQSVIESVLFYHPSVWWISSIVRKEREHCCDDLAIRALGDRASYVRALVDLESLRIGSPSLALKANGGSLVDRVRRIAGSPQRSSFPGSLWVLLAVSLAIAMGFSRGVEKKPEPVLMERISGRVLTYDGKPAGGATVVGVGFDVKARTGPFIGEVKTGADGTFKLDLPTASSRSLYAYLRGNALTTLHRVIGAQVDLRLSKPAFVRVQVVQPSGAPLAYVRVQPSDIVGVFGGFPRLDLFRQMGRLTDAHGWVTIPDFSAGSGVALEVDDDRYAVGTDLITAANGTGLTHQFIVHPACRLKGTISLDGRPVANAFVMANSANDPPANSFSRSDSNGRFEFKRLPKGDWAITTLLNRDLSRDWTVKRTRVSLRPNTDSQVDLKLFRGAIVEGSVVDAQGRPKPNARLSVIAIDDYGRFLHGEFVDPAGPDGKFRARIPGGHYSFITFGHDGEVLKQIKILDGETKHLTLKLPDESDLIDKHVKVLDADGKPAAGVEVTCGVIDSKGKPQGMGVITDAKGEATVTIHKAEETSLDFSVNVGDQRIQNQWFARNKPIVLRLRRFQTASIEGVVEDAAGKPISGATVTIVFANNSSWAGGMNYRDQKHRTGPDGRYRFEGLFPEITAMIEAKVVDHLYAHTEEARVTSGERHVFPPLRLVSASHISGRVIDQHGKPINDAEVDLDKVRPPSNGIRRTDSAGRFRFDQIPSGEYHLALLFGDQQAEYSVRSGVERDFVLRR